MSEFEESRTLTCPCCKKRFAECEGPLCSCEEDARDVLAEMEMQREIDYEWLADQEREHE